MKLPALFSIAKLQNVVNRCLSPFDVHLFFEQKSLAAYSLLEEGLRPQAAKGGPDHEKIVRRVLAAYQAAKLAQKTAPDPYKAGRAWEFQIQTYRKNYLDALASTDVSLLGILLADFFRNSGTSGAWTYADYATITKSSRWKKKWFINSVLNDYATWKDFVDESDLSPLSAPRIGNPWGLKLAGRLVMPVSFRHHYDAHHVKNLLVDIKAPVVVEIGGGFGGFAYYLMKGQKPLTYCDFDLPEILLIASYYLICAFPEKRILLFGERNTENLSTAIQDYDVLLMPNFQLETLPDYCVDLFINTHSLSEMDYQTVREYISHITRTCRHYFFHVNSDRKIVIHGDHTEVPASEFAIPEQQFKRIYKSYSPWGGGSGRIREHLYEIRPR